MMGHVKELTHRVRANEKVVASVSLLGVIACTIIGAGYFAPKADANTSGQWIHDIREHRAQQTRTDPEESINNALADLEQYGRDDTTEQEILLQLQGDPDRQSIGWGYDRRDNRSWLRSLQKGEGQDSWSGYPREEDEKS